MACSPQSPLYLHLPKYFCLFIFQSLLIASNIATTALGIVSKANLGSPTKEDLKESTFDAPKRIGRDCLIAKNNSRLVHLSIIKPSYAHYLSTGGGHAGITLK